MHTYVQTHTVIWSHPWTLRLCDLGMDWHSSQLLPVPSWAENHHARERLASS